jgi:hypothetical protein
VAEARGGSGARLGSCFHAFVPLNDDGAHQLPRMPAKSEHVIRSGTCRGGKCFTILDMSICSRAKVPKTVWPRKSASVPMREG